MLSSAEFIDFILKGGASPPRSRKKKAAAEAALPEGFEGFDAEEPSASLVDGSATFAQRLLEAAGFGYPELVQRDSVIRSSDAVAKHLPDRASYWPKTADRPYQTLLFETTLTHKELLAIPAFRGRKLHHLDIVEDALARLVSEALEGFQRGGQGVTAEVRRGVKHETLCVISILDERDAEPVRLLCFGTQNAKTEGLETFHITEQTRFWDPQLARDHLALVYERQFKRLVGSSWQEAFTTTEERKKAERLLEVCTGKRPTEKDIQESVLDLLETVAKGFGLKKSGSRRLKAFALPADHDIGIDPDEREGKHGGVNPFGGVTLRDEQSRLLGYIIYPLKNKADAERLRKHLAAYNRFHNVLVVYPDASQASLELWQGREQLTGKLRKDQGYRDAADVVNLLSRFFVVSKAKVRNPAELAQELAYRAQYLRRLAVKQLEDEPEKGPLRNLYNAFKEALVHDQTEDEFADAFAQTITYGLLTARWTGNDELMANGERLTRKTALKHLPPGSPFLNDLFSSVLSVKLDEQRGRLLWLVDDIADLLDRIDVTYVFGAGDEESDSATDPVIHFYEPFLAAYDKELKHKRGVFFTPRPVVSYIVRSVHEVLQKELGLEDGLASTDTWSDVAKRIEGLKIPEGVKASDPFVCILDPATGTGTFLFECIEVIERTMKSRWCEELGTSDWGSQAIATRWHAYVRSWLLPRLMGFELMMASYAIAHLKLSFKLKETGFVLVPGDRLNIYLTNSLEGPSQVANPKVANLFAGLATEAQEVDRVKRDHRFTVVIGNPPYSGHSSNSGDWARMLVSQYRRIGDRELKLAQGKWLQNDYVKFIGLAERVLGASKSGVLGFITDHSYIDGDTFPGLRHSLMTNFAGIEVLDLHGSLTRREAAPTGGTDENVFDIQQGVAITIAWTTAPRCSSGVATPSLAQLFVADLWGARVDKFLTLSSVDSRSHALRWKKISASDERFLFVSTSDNGAVDVEFDSFDGVDVLFSRNGKPAPGFLTTHDSFAIAFTQDGIVQNVEALIASKTESEARQAFKLCSQQQWQYGAAKTALKRSGWRQLVRSCLYRPFDERWTVYDPHVLVHRRERVNTHLLEPGNMALLTTRMTKGDDFSHVFVTDRITEVICLSSKTSANAFVFPLYLRGEQPTLPGVHSEGASNLSPEIVDKYRGIAGRLATPRAIFFYAYAVLHSPTYRARYNVRLVREFPRIPKPGSLEIFRDLASAGEVLVTAHLGAPASTTIALHGEGDRVVANGMPKYDGGRVHINRTQYIEPISPNVWSHKIGSYDVCRRWLSQRRGVALSANDVKRFAAMVSAIEATVREQVKIDDAVAKHGGWPGAFVATTTGNT